MAWNKNVNTSAPSKSVIANLLKAGVAISFTLFLVACGGDSSNSSKAEGNDSGREVGTLAEMGRCTSEREGDTVYVAEKLTDFLCQNKTWIDLSEISDGGNSPDVMSGSSSATSEKDELNASSSSFNKDAYTGDNLVVKNRSILGVAQKGPFRFGSPVYLRELSEESLNYTGMVYEDEISSNKGDFVIPNVNLISPYACVEVHGQYRNEITGEYSKDSISLFALTDLKTALSDAKNEPRNKVNVNLLTHLEYNRALYLVHKGYSVYAAKKQADQEIMTAFELPTTVKYSEDLSVFEDSQDDNVNYANASLMVLSLLFLGERTDTEIQAAIDKFIEDFEADGVWDDAETKAAMADYATEIDISEIRANVKAWNILSIPQFEDPLEMFWNNVYGLGGCSDKRKDVVVPNSNKLSKNYKKYFICNGSHWDDATTYQKDTYKWSAGKSGELKKGNVTDTIYVYNGTKWEVSERETTIGLCQNSNAGVVSKFNGTYYICKNNAWGTATVLEYDTYRLTGAEGDVKAGMVNKDKYYVYENGTWRAAANEIENNFGACIASRESEKHTLDDKYYICKNNAWETATPLEYDTYGKICLTDGSIVAGEVIADNKYVCDAGVFRAAQSIEISLDKGCVSYTEGNVIKKPSIIRDSVCLCQNSLWKVIVVEHGSLTDTRDSQTYKIVTIGNQTWMAENLNYRYIQKTYKGGDMDTSSYCYDNDIANCNQYGRLYLWSAAMDSAGIFSQNGVGCGYFWTCTHSYTVRGICPEGWHLPSRIEWQSLIDNTAAFGGKYNVLKSATGWKEDYADVFSFTALPAGRWDGSNNSFNRKGSYAFFWSSTEDKSGSYAYLLELSGHTLSANYYKKDGFSVRCVKD